MFLQHTSREGDPQLHVHIAVMNLAQRADGADPKWRTLHGSMLYQDRLAVAAYAPGSWPHGLLTWAMCWCRARMATGLRSGAWTGVKDLFSSRRAQITPEVARMAAEYRARYGREPSRRTLWAMAQAATLETRKAKARGRTDRRGQGAPRSAGEELDAWEARTTEREIDALSEVHEAVATFARPEGLEAPAELDASSRARIIRVAVAQAQRCSAAFTRAAVLWEVHLAMPAMAPGVDQAALAQELAGEALASGEVLALGPGPDVVDVAALGVRAQ